MIFPEGTRARDGKIKTFKPAGLAALLRSVENPLVYPVTIEGSWLVSARPKGPIPRGIRIRIDPGDPIDPARFESSDAVIQEAFRVISSRLDELRRAG